MTTILETWPAAADQATISGAFTFYVYDGSALLEVATIDDVCSGESTDVQMVEEELRELARVATWAADRLATR